jgi:hypothetical protein
VLRDLPRLDAAEYALFDDLRAQRLRDNTRGVKPPMASVRLEQERIGFAWLQRALAALVSRSSVEPVFTQEFEGKK